VLPIIGSYIFFKYLYGQFRSDNIRSDQINEMSGTFCY